MHAEMSRKKPINGIDGACSLSPYQPIHGQVNQRRLNDACAMRQTPISLGANYDPLDRLHFFDRPFLLRGDCLDWYWRASTFPPTPSFPITLDRRLFATNFLSRFSFAFWIMSLMIGSYCSIKFFTTFEPFGTAKSTVLSHSLRTRGPTIRSMVSRNTLKRLLT